MNRRLRGLLRKEFLQVLRDPSSIAIAFVLPVFLLLLFGYGVSMDSKHVPIGLVIERPSAEAQSFAGAFAQSRYFEPRHFANRQQGRAALRERRVDGLVVLPADFSERLKGERNAPIQLLVNGVDANSARLLEGYVQGVWSNWLQRELAARAMPLAQPVTLEPRIWFNAELRSRNYLVPGLLVVNMTLIGALLTALVMAREWERGTLEALMVTPVTLREILIGKTHALFRARHGRHGPVGKHGPGAVRGAAARLLLAVLLLASIAVSARAPWAWVCSSRCVAKNQFIAGMIAIIATFLPAFLLSGFLFDIDSMPWVVQAVTHIMAARYFVAILQTPVSGR